MIAMEEQRTVEQPLVPVLVAVTRSGLALPLPVRPAAARRVSAADGDQGEHLIA